MIERLETIPADDVEARLLFLEEFVDRGYQTFVEVGAALLEIRESKLYRNHYSTFDDYCRDRWGISDQQALNYMRASRVLGNLGKEPGKTPTIVGVLPTSEWQARPLASLKEPEEQRVAWASVVEEAAGEGITAGMVRERVQGLKELKQRAPDLFEAVRAGERKLATAITEAKRRGRPHPPPAAVIPEGKFTVIYADPPWKYDHMRVDAWAVENTYPTMTLEELVAMAPKIEALSTDETALFLWATSTKLDWAVDLLRAWGFDHKSSMVWIKHRNAAGMGYWGRIGHELVLIGARCKAKPPPPERRFPSVIEAPKGEHSEKPQEMRCLIERMFPDARRLELFARGAPPEGWSFWGTG